jgi:DNA-binding transcriptional regulator YdaS (Cro superfamily)
MTWEATKLLRAALLQLGCNPNNLVVEAVSMSKNPLHRAVKAKPFEGNQSRFADAIGTSQQNISNWLKKNRPLPAEYVLRAEMVTGIPRHAWRPDIYPVPAQEAAA